jgi:hypothetical protein
MINCTECCHTIGCNCAGTCQLEFFNWGGSFAVAAGVCLAIAFILVILRTFIEINVEKWKKKHKK